MKVSLIFLLVALVALAAGCTKTVDKAIGTGNADLVQEQRIQSDINWEALDIGEVDFGSLAMDDVERSLADVDANLD